MSTTIYRQFLSSKLPRTGIPRMDTLQDKPWGLREFAIVDPDGNLVRIGQVLAEQSPARTVDNAAGITPKGKSV